MNVSSAAASAYNGFVPDTNQLAHTWIDQKDRVETTLNSRFLVQYRNGNIRVNLPDEEAYQISVFDLAGKQIWHSNGKNGASQQANINIYQKLNPGIYIAKIESASLREMVKFVVAK